MRNQLAHIFFLLLLSPMLYSQCPLEEAIDFKTVNINGDSIHLFELLETENKYVLIDFFYADCAPCQNSAPFINEAYEYFGCGDFDVEFISISERDSDSICHIFDETYGVHFSTISGIEGGGSQIANQYEIRAFPTVILIAHDLRIVEQDIYPIPNAGHIINPLEIYGIEQNECIDYTIDAQFSSDTNTICNGQMIQFTNHSIGPIEQVKWYFEGGSPPSSTLENPEILYNSAGTFYVQLLISNQYQTDTLRLDDYISVQDCSGIGSIRPYRMIISPNPGNGVFKVSLPENGVFQVQVFDITGQVVFTSQFSAGLNDMDISYLNKGVYILIANNGSVHLKERVVIK